MTNLGFALVPSAEDRERIFELVDKLTSRFDFRPDAILTRDYLPHISLWQGPYSSTEKVIEELGGIDLTGIRLSQTVTEIQIWASKIVFLNLEKNDAVRSLHLWLFDKLSPLKEPGSADPQTLRGVTEDQARSFHETGYPFTEKGYGALVPHFTLGHLAHELDDKTSQRIGSEMTEFWKGLQLLSVSFERFIVFVVQPLGKCPNDLENREQIPHSIIIQPD